MVIFLLDHDTPAEFTSVLPLGYRSLFYLILKIPVTVTGDIEQRWKETYDGLFKNYKKNEKNSRNIDLDENYYSQYKEAQKRINDFLGIKPERKTRKKKEI